MAPIATPCYSAPATKCARTDALAHRAATRQTTYPPRSRHLPTHRRTQVALLHSDDGFDRPEFAEESAEADEGEGEASVELLPYVATAQPQARPALITHGNRGRSPSPYGNRRPYTAQLSGVRTFDRIVRVNGDASLGADGATAELARGAGGAGCMLTLQPARLRCSGTKRGPAERTLRRLSAPDVVRCLWRYPQDAATQQRGAEQLTSRLARAGASEGRADLLSELRAAVPYVVNALEVCIIYSSPNRRMPSASLFIFPALPSLRDLLLRCTVARRACSSPLPSSSPASR